MIAALDNFPPLTPAEYLGWEEQQELRYEYAAGQIYAMTGGTVNHSKIAMNIGPIVRNHLRGSRCQILNSDGKVQIAESCSFFYPDFSVTCDERDGNASQYISHPCLIIEVLSPGTEAYDRGEKFSLYRRSNTLQEYVLVSTKAISIDIYRRNERDRWEIISYGSGETVELESIGLSFAIEQIYEDIIFADLS